MNERPPPGRPATGLAPRPVALPVARGERSAHVAPERSRLYRVLAILWVFPSLGAVLILTLEPGGAKGRPGESVLDVVRAIRLEQYVGLGLLALHLFFVIQVWRYRSRYPR